MNKKEIKDLCENLWNDINWFWTITLILIIIFGLIYLQYFWF